MKKPKNKQVIMHQMSMDFDDRKSEEKERVIVQKEVKPGVFGYWIYDETTGPYGKKVK